MNYEKIWNKVDGLPWCTIMTGSNAAADYFQSLLDSHPELIVFSCQLRFHVFWERSFVAKHGGDINPSDFIEEFNGHYIRKLISKYDYAERKDQLGINKDESFRINLDELKRHFLGLISAREVTRRNCLVAIYVAYSLCMGENIEQKKMFIHHVQRRRYLGEVLADFPDSKFIYVARDPRSAYVSGVENWPKFEPKADHPAFHIYILDRNLQDAEPLMRAGVDLRVIRIEDLHDEEMLHVISDWLGIDYDSCMKASTFAGLLNNGDRPQPNLVAHDENGHSTFLHDNGWQNILSRLDLFLFGYLLHDRLKWYGYPNTVSSAPINAELAFFAILLPIHYERRFLSPGFQLATLGKRNIRLFLGIYYHYLRRVLYFYKLYAHQTFGNFFNPQIFRTKNTK